MKEGQGTDGRVLIVEDHVPTSRLMATAFHEAPSEVTCVEVRTAEEALRFLTRQGDPSHEPEIVLLDLDLPGGSGFDVLQTLKNDPELRRKPVVVVSARTSQDAINRSYDLHARTFIRKPDDWSGFMDLATAITHYWFQTAKWPDASLHPSTSVDDRVVEVE